MTIAPMPPAGGALPPGAVQLPAAPGPAPELPPISAGAPAGAAEAGSALGDLLGAGVRAGNSGAADAVLPFPTLAQRAAYVDALRSAAIVPGSEHVMSTSGKSGAPTKLRLQTDAGQLEAVSKPHNAGELRGQFAQDVLLKFGLDRMVPPSAVRDDRTISMFVHAKEARTLGITDEASLLATLTKHYDLEQPALPVAERARLAARDLQLVQLFDGVVAVSDRHRRNILADDAGGTFLHDNDGLGFGGNPKHPSEPHLSATYLPDGPAFHRDIVLSDDTRSFLKGRITGNDLRELAKPYLAKDPDFAHPDEIEHMAQRLDSALETGTLRVRTSPITDFNLNVMGDFFADHPFAQKVGTALGKVFSHGG